MRVPSLSSLGVRPPLWREARIGLADANALANVEHLLGFLLGAATILALDRWASRSTPA